MNSKNDIVVLVMVNYEDSLNNGVYDYHFLQYVGNGVVYQSIKVIY